MAQDILAQIAALKAVVSDEKAQVDAVVGSLTARVADLTAEVAALKDQIQGDASNAEIMAALELLGLHIEGIITPEVEAEEPATEPEAEAPESEIE